jgi:hypothetical protein
MTHDARPQCRSPARCPSSWTASVSSRDRRTPASAPDPARSGASPTTAQHPSSAASPKIAPTPSAQRPASAIASRHRRARPRPPRRAPSISACIRWMERYRPLSASRHSSRRSIASPMHHCTPSSARRPRPSSSSSARSAPPAGISSTGRRLRRRRGRIRRRNASRTFTRGPAPCTRPRAARARGDTSRLPSSVSPRSLPVAEGRAWRQMQDVGPRGASIQNDGRAPRGERPASSLIHRIRLTSACTVGRCRPRAGSSAGR